VDQGLSRRSMLKFAIGGAAGVAVGLLSSTAAAARTTAPALAEPAAATIKLVNVEHDSRPLDNAAYAAVYQAFQAQNPDITIDFQIIPWEQARPKMLTLAQGNSLPDMGRMSWPDDYAAAQMVVPLDGMVDQSALARFDAAGLDQFSAEGSDGKKHLYGLPWFSGDAAILVNKTLFDSAGLSLKDSWTTDDFTQYAKTLTQAGQQWGVALDVAESTLAIVITPPREVPFKETRRNPSPLTPLIL